jgi:RNA polymerase sigma factor (sigma-70 family)
LPARLSQRLDPEDVVQSVYRCFFRKARDGRYDSHPEDDLWRLLATITLHKVYNQVKGNRAGRRSFEREQSFGSEDSLHGISPEAFAREPTPLEALTLADQLEQVMRPLTPPQRRMLELRLQGHTLEEIATQTGRSQRTVRRLLEEVKANLERGNGEASP